MNYLTKERRRVSESVPEVSLQQGWASITTGSPKTPKGKATCIVPKCRRKSKPFFYRSILFPLAIDYFQAPK